MYINDGMCSTTDPLAVTWAAFIFFSIHERLHSASLLFLTDVCVEHGRAELLHRDGVSFEFLILFGQPLFTCCL